MNNLRVNLIEKEAKEFRKICSSDNYGIIDIFDSCEKNGYRMIRFPLEDDALLGFSQIRDGENIIFSNSSQILSREIFTVAHEIGHHILGHVNDTNSMIKDIGAFGSNEIETEAHYFAASLLVPEELLLLFIHKELNDKKNEIWKALDVAKVQTAFNVSYDMILNRMQAIKCISDDVYKRLKNDKLEISVSSLLKIIDGNDDLCKPSLDRRVPAEYLTWVIENYNMKLIPKETIEKAFSYFNCDLSSVIQEPDSGCDKQPDNIDDLLGGLD